MPARGRGPRRATNSSAATASAFASGASPNWARGWVSSANRGTGARSSAAATTSRPASRPAGLSASGVPAESSSATPKRAISAATPAREIAIGGDESGGLALPLQAVAQQQSDGEGFRARVVRLHHADAGHSGAQRRRRQAIGKAGPEVGGLGLPHGLAHQPLAAERGGRGQRQHIAARHAEARQQPGKAILGMVRRRVPPIGDAGRRRRRRDPGRGPAAPRRPWAGRRWRPEAGRWPAWSRWSPPRLPGRHRAPGRRGGGLPHPPARRGGRPAPPVRRCPDSR